MHATCAAAFAGSHLCHYEEYALSNSATQPPASGAWLDPSCAESTDNLGALTLQCNHWGEALPGSGRMIYVDPNYDYNCAGWTSASSSYQGLSIQVPGGTPVSCTSALPLACCNTVYYETFRGFSTATTSGSGGGRASLNAVCANQYAGSHLCHLVEYHRANPTTIPPATGAWVDASSVANYGFITNVGAMPNAGRFTGTDSTYNQDNCKNWTSNASSNSGWVVQPSGTNTSPCTATLPVACCGG